MNNSSALLQYFIYLVLLVALAVPLGGYIGRVMTGKRVFLSHLLLPCENLLYRLLGIDRNEKMSWKRYAASALTLSGVGLVAVMAVLMLQGHLPMNPEKLPGLSWHLAFNTAASFITNTNWQAYQGESTLSYFSQSMGLTVQNFLSAAVGISVLFALIRGFVRIREKNLGCFWVDVTRAVLYILLPICLVLSLVLVSQGVVQSLEPYRTVDLAEAVVLEDGTAVTRQMVPMGPQASQVAPKQFGTNGGGFNGTNSASPLENPTPLSNLAEMLSILLIPVSLCFAFGGCVKDANQGKSIFCAMLLVLVMALVAVGVNEHAATPQLAQDGLVDITAMGQAGGNMEGKETRFGIATSSVWASFTTAASSGSVNSMHDSYTPLGGMALMLLMQLGEVAFGGAGSGLCGMLGFVVLTVFVAGLMVGRTPEYLGKKIESREMKMAALICLATPVAILAGGGIAAAVPQVMDSISAQGAHGFSQMLYAFTACGGNNGSAFRGFDANTPFLNTILGLVMLFARFVPMLAALAMGGSLAAKKPVAASMGTLPTNTIAFTVLLVVVVVMIGALSFLPALTLGPIAEYFQMIS